MVDWNSYPFCNTFGIAVNNTAPGVGGSENWPVLEVLTTPIAYQTSIFSDSFVARKRTGSVYTGTDSQPGMNGTYSSQPTIEFYKLYLYTSTTPSERFRVPTVNTGKGIAYVLHSAGPDLISINMGGVLANQSSNIASASPAYCSNLFYDPTNGTISFGEIYRTGGQTGGGYGSVFYQTAGIAK